MYIHTDREKQQLIHSRHKSTSPVVLNMCTCMYTYALILTHMQQPKTKYIAWTEFQNSKASERDSSELIKTKPEIFTWAESAALSTGNSLRSVKSGLACFFCFPLSVSFSPSIFLTLDIRTQVYIHIRHTHNVTKQVRGWFAREQIWLLPSKTWLPLTHTT